jgi:hypothetical protein
MKIIYQNEYYFPPRDFRYFLNQTVTYSSIKMSTASIVKSTVVWIVTPFKVSYRLYLQGLNVSYSRNLAFHLFLLVPCLACLLTLNWSDMLLIRITLSLNYTASYSYRRENLKMTPFAPPSLKLLHFVTILLSNSLFRPL